MCSPTRNSILKHGRLRTSDFNFDLPQELIAQRPALVRDHSRLMVVSRSDGSIHHRRFYDLPDYLSPRDLLVLNDSRVFPARLLGRRTPTGGAVEVLLHHPQPSGAWRALVRPGRRMREGASFEVSSGSASIRGRIVAVEPDGSRIVELEGEEHVDALGVTPLPPYVREPLDDPDRYQTVYARHRGSVAAPTAGLHFTPELLDRIRDSGVEVAFVTLHVGWGSFRPVQTEDIDSHEIHSENYELSTESAAAVNTARRDGRRIVVAGTTAVRLLEHAAARCAGPARTVEGGSGWADLFITPGHSFRAVDALITNFHLPRSTLLMLTCAIGGRDLVLRAYREAVRMRYRFYSFGDAMLIL